MTHFTRFLGVLILALLAGPWWDTATRFESGLELGWRGLAEIAANPGAAYSPPTDGALAPFWAKRRSLIAIGFVVLGGALIIAVPRRGPWATIGAICACAGVDSIIVYGAVLEPFWPGPSLNQFLFANAVACLPLVLAVIGSAGVFTRHRVGRAAGWLLALGCGLALLGTFVILWGGAVAGLLAAAVFAIESRRWYRSAKEEGR